MFACIGLGHEYVDFLSQGFGSRVAENVFSGRIENNDAGLPINENNRVLRRFDQRAEGIVCSDDSSAVGELVRSSLHVF